jgi:hypothetical protein
MLDAFDGSILFILIDTEIHTGLFASIAMLLYNSVRWATLLAIFASLQQKGKAYAWHGIAPIGSSEWNRSLSTKSKTPVKC